jgi:uncharacterized protein
VIDHFHNSLIKRTNSNLDVIKLLIRLVAQLTVLLSFISVSCPASGQSLEEIFKATRADDSKTVAGLLDRGMDPNSTDKEGYTLLMIAAQQGYSDLVRLLLAHKATVDRRSPFGDTALLMGSLKGHLEVVELLVGAGAQVDREGGWTPLGYAAFGGDPALVRFLLSKGADKNAVQPNGYTPLMLAVRNGHSGAARELLYADADFDYMAPDGETALSLARRGKDPAIAQLLEQAGAAR